MGPVVVHKSKVRDPHNLGIWLRLNGEVKQEESTDHLIHDVASLKLVNNSVPSCRRS